MESVLGFRRRRAAFRRDLPGRSSSLGAVDSLVTD